MILSPTSLIGHHKNPIPVHNVITNITVTNFNECQQVTVMLVTSLFWWLYDGDWFQMLVAESLCWRLFTLCWWFSQCIISVTNILNRSPTSQTCHQHIWSPTTVTNIDVTMSTALRCHQHYGSPRFEVQTLSSKLSFWVIISQFKKMNH